MVAARTAPNRSVRFGGEHGALDDRGRRDARWLAERIDAAVIVSGPELSVRQTAAAASGVVEIIPSLCTLDVGRWRGVAPPDLTDTELVAWFTDPGWAGHGGESVTAFVERIRDAAARTRREVLLVAKPVAQALLCGDAATFFAVDVRPASVHDLDL